MSLSLCIIHRAPTPTPFPYTTLFRAHASARAARHGQPPGQRDEGGRAPARDRKSTRLNSSHRCSSYAVFCLKKKKYCRPKQRRKLCDLKLLTNMVTNIYLMNLKGILF